MTTPLCAEERIEYFRRRETAALGWMRDAVLRAASHYTKEKDMTAIDKLNEADQALTNISDDYSSGGETFDFAVEAARAAINAARALAADLEEKGEANAES